MCMKKIRYVKKEGNCVLLSLTNREKSAYKMRFRLEFTFSRFFEKNRVFVMVKGKSKVHPNIPAKAQSGGSSTELPILILGVRMGWWSILFSNRFYRGKGPEYPLYRRLGRSRFRSRLVQKLSPSRDSTPGPPSP